MENRPNYFIWIGLILLLFSVMQIFTSSPIDLPFAEIIGYSVMPHFPFALFVMGIGMFVLAMRREGSYLLAAPKGLIIEVSGWIVSSAGLLYLILAGFSHYNTGHE